MAQPLPVRCSRAPPRTVPLTALEFTVARPATTGFTNRADRGRADLSVKTVGYHLSNIYAELGISSRMGLMDRLAALSSPVASTSPGGAGSDLHALIRLVTPCARASLSRC
ncbi:LuxR C-terminal-related transcriptional regulator, partial [Streptomyces sp. NPDC006307]|uniref:LuxR C-terminal-related transcriptional regulator n=1 Tax=Streptomyces sp. NPDC006307 TaxID=3156748 RepID=UPI0033B7580C